MTGKAALPNDSQTQRMRSNPVRELPVRTLVGRVLEHGTSGNETGTTAFDALVFRMLDACLSTDPDCLQREVNILNECGVPARTIAETFVPRVAHELGELWCEDNLGFALVTIGCARLQAILRNLGPAWYGASANDRTGLEILIAIPRGEDHTLGGLVTTGKLRRMGHRVHSVMGEGMDVFAEVVSHRSFDLILISASGRESLEKLSELVEVGRTASPKRTIIAIGGSILLEDGAEVGRIKVRTGADLVTNDLDEALRRCKKTNLLNVSPLSRTNSSRGSN